MVAREDVSPQVIRNGGVANQLASMLGHGGEIWPARRKALEQLVEPVGDHGPVGPGGNAESWRRGQPGRDHHPQVDGLAPGIGDPVGTEHREVDQAFHEVTVDLSDEKFNKR